MGERTRRWARAAAFPAAGAAAGLIYGQFAGCAGGACAITSSPLGTVAYFALLGWLLSGVLAEAGEG